MTDNLRGHATGRLITLEARNDEELQAARRRLVLAADADRRSFERALHEGVQQDLVALAVSLQLVTQAVESDPPAAKELLEEMARDVRQAIAETAALAQRIHPPMLESGGLAAVLRAAAVSSGVRGPVEVALDGGCAPEVAFTVYLCWLHALERVDRAAITVREHDGSLAFDIVGGGDLNDLDRLRDRVEALGGELAIAAEPGGGTRASGSLPL
jgi:Signal transduction histidine kinase